MIRTLVPDSDPILHMSASAIDLDADTASLHMLIRDLWETLEFHRGYGLAAVQVGQPFRLFVMRTVAKKLVVINPIVLSESEDTTPFVEGCLSYPGQDYEVIRANRIKVSYYNGDLDHKSHYLNGMDARVFAHETDHCNGLTMHDRGKVWVNPET